MKQFLFQFAVVLFAATACQESISQQADSAFSSFFQEYLDGDLRMRPLTATYLGDHRFDDRLDDLSSEARASRTAFVRKTLENLPMVIDFEDLSRPSQIDFEILKHELEKELWLAENTKRFERDPRVYNNYINDSIYLLLTQSTLPKETNIRNCISRMALIPQVIEAAKKNLAAPPRVITETAIRQNRGAISFYEGELFALAGETPQKTRLEGAAARVVNELKGYQRFLEEQLLPGANGEWRIGRKKFEQKVELELDAGLSADQVLSDAKAEFTRVVDEMYVIARQLWSRYFPDTVLPPDDPDGRRATIQHVLQEIGREHGSPEDLILDARNTVNRIREFIRSRKLLTLPEPDRCQVIEMPEFQRGNSIAFLNSAPPLENSAISIYAISPPPSDWNIDRVTSFMEEYNRHMLQILTIHEAYPGHYVQLEYANRNPSLVRRILGSGVYVEGWAVYTEQTLLDQGYGNGDLALRLSQLKFYLRAVGNAILDHNMHCTTITDDEALKFLVDEVFQSEGEARLKIIRAKQSSVQLSTYFVGRMAHYRLRQKIQREMGEAFDLGGYHEAVLKQGSVPVKYLPELVRLYFGLPDR